MLTGSAKISLKTVDVSELVPAVSTSIGAVVFSSPKGEIDRPVLITNKAQFIEEYAKPAIAEYGKQSALGFLQLSRRLYCQRVALNALYGGLEVAKTGGVSAVISAGVAAPKSSYVFESADAVFAVFGKDPGVWNNKISVKVLEKDAAEYIFTIEVYYEDDDGVDQLVETFDMSRKTKIDGYGAQLYLENKINDHSKYIWVVDNTAQLDTVLPEYMVAVLTIAQGADGDAVTDTELVTGWAKFENPQDYTVNILINGGYTGATVQTKMKNVAEARVDCICVLDIPLTDINTAAAMASWRATQNLNSSFCALYGPWIKVFDEYNGQVISIPPSGDIAAIYAYTDYIYGSAHGAPAGYNRGILDRVLSLDFGSDLNKKSFTIAEMDALDDAQVNPLYNDPGWGILVYGEETEQTKRSALSNVHVRRLVNQIAVATTRAAKGYLFEPLLERTYFRVRMMMEQYFSELEGLGAFDNVAGRGWKVVCDETNNSASDRDSNQMNIWLFIKPVRVAKYIEIKAIITRSTASFEAIISTGIVG